MADITYRYLVSHVKYYMICGSTLAKKVPAEIRPAECTHKKILLYLRLRLTLGLAFAAAFCFASSAARLFGPM